MTQAQNTPISPELQAMAQTLAQHPDYQVLTRFNPEVLNATVDAIPDDAALGVMVDTETTGRGDEDKIIELGMVVFAFNRDTGELYGVVDSYDALEDPGMPIPPEATRVNNISDEMVKGKRIDDNRVNAILETVEVVIAHNSGFDRPYCERRWPMFKSKAWACSLTQLNWAEAGLGSAKLDYIAYRLGFFFEAHRASMDCLALLYALSKPMPGQEQTGLALLLQAYRDTSRLIWAVGAPFDAKDLLKARGYRWSDGSKPGTQKAWNKAVPEEEYEAELQWLKASVFGNRQFSVPVETVDAFVRFSGRNNSAERVYR